MNQSPATLLLLISWTVLSLLSATSLHANPQGGGGGDPGPDYSAYYSYSDFGATHVNAPHNGDLSVYEIFSEFSFDRTGQSYNGNELIQSIRLKVTLKDEEAAKVLTKDEVIEVHIEMPHLFVHGDGIPSWMYPKAYGHSLVTFSSGGFEVISGEMVPRICPDGGTSVGDFVLKYKGQGDAYININSGVYNAVSTVRGGISWCRETRALSHTPDDVGSCLTCSGCGPGNETCPPRDSGKDNLQVSLPSTSSVGAGCSSCAGGSSNGNENGFFLGQSFHPEQIDARSSFGPGMFSNYDCSLTFYRLCHEDDLPSKYRAFVFDPCSGRTQEFFNDGGDSAFDPVEGSGFLPFTLTGANGAPLSEAQMEDLTNAEASLIRKEDGSKFKFVLKNASSSNDGADADVFESQLRTITASGGQAVSLTYITDVRDDAEYPGDHKAQLRIETISDEYGVVGSPVYFYSGSQWSWDKVVITGYDHPPSALEVDFIFSGYNLMRVERNGNPIMTYDRDAAPTPEFDGALRLTRENLLEWGPARKTSLIYTDSYYGGLGSTWNQFEGFILGRQDGSGTTYSKTIPDVTEPGLYTVEYRDQTMTWVPGQSLQYGSETTFASVVGATASDISFNTPPTTVDATGYVTEHEYDDRGNRIKSYHHRDSPEETYELSIYDDDNLMVYSRDRGGFVTVVERDGDGNVLRRIRGLKDNDDVVDDTGFVMPVGAQPLQDTFGYGANGLVEWSATEAYTPGPGQAPPVNARIDYRYDSNNRLNKQIKPLPHGQSVRPEVQYTWAGASLDQMVSERGFAVDYFYDPIGRLVSTAYHDGSTEQTWFDDANRNKYSKNRNGVVSFENRDEAWRVKKVESAYGRDVNLLDNGIDSTNPIHLRSQTVYSYPAGHVAPKYKTTNKGLAITTYDYRGRVKQVTNFPRKKTYRRTQYDYKNNLLFSTEELFPGFARRTYRAYSSDRQTVRTVNTRVSAVTFADNAELLAAVRTPPNGLSPDHVINDAVRDVRGNIIQMFDARGTETRSEFDEHSRMIQQTKAFGSDVALTTSYEFDGEGNQVKVTDPANVQTYSIYDDADNVKIRKVGYGTPLQLTTQYEYDADGAQLKMIEPSGAVTQYLRSDCCGRSKGTRDGLGNGRITNQDAGGRTVHNAIVEDYDLHTDLHDPIDTKTIGESTMRYFDNGQIQFQTVWKSALGSIDIANPPIAGIDGVDADLGVTTQNAYDNFIGDGNALDSAAGLEISLLGGGSANININAALAKLAQSVSDGGGGISFNPLRGGTASVSMSPDEKAMSVSIRDGMGRGVMSAQMYGPRAAAPNTLINWSCVLHEKTYSLAGFGTTESVWQIDPDGYKTQSLTDGYGLQVATIDELGHSRKTFYSADGKPRYVYDAKGELTIHHYDDLGRRFWSRDPLFNITQVRYDAGGRMNRTIDSNGNSSWTYFDALSRVVQQRDRGDDSIYRTYDFAGRLETIKDAQNKITTYVHDILGQRTATTLADGSSRAMDYDAAGRLEELTMNSGKKQVLTYKFGGPLERKDYFDINGAPSGSDVFYFDEFLRSSGSLSRDSVTLGRTYNDRGQTETETTSYAWRLSVCVTVRHELAKNSHVNLEDD